MFSLVPVVKFVEKGEMNRAKTASKKSSITAFFLISIGQFQSYIGAHT